MGIKYRFSPFSRLVEHCLPQRGYCPFVRFDVKKKFIRKKMAKAQDQELKKAFTELQQKMIDTTQKLKLADVQIDSLKRTKQHAELTIKEVTSLPTNTKTYESVGRMFLLDDIASIKEGLDKRIKTADEKIKTLENNKSFLERSLKDNANSVREMVQQRQSNESSG